jgi:hypothetical protein
MLNFSRCDRTVNLPLPISSVVKNLFIFTINLKIINLKTNSMRIKQILVAFLFATLVISCGGKAEDIDVKELETKCDLVDAMEIVMDKIIVLGEAVYPEEGVLAAITYGFEGSKEQKKEYESLGEKVKEIAKRADELGFKESDLEDCPNFKTVEKKMKKVKSIRRILN